MFSDCDEIRAKEHSLPPPGACSTLRLYGPPMYVYAAVKMYVLFPFVLSPVPCYDDVVLQAVLTITHSADFVWLILMS